MIASPYAAERTGKNGPATVSPRFIQQSISTRQQIVNELIAGRLPLLEATARFQTVHSASANSLANATGVLVGTGEGEHMCRTVIGWVHLTLCQRPEEAERVTAKLEQELQGCIESCGTIQLPSNF